MNTMIIKVSIGLSLSLSLGFICADADAAILSLKPGTVYMGKESLNERLTGNSCFITIHRVDLAPEKGMHCHSVDFLFASERTDVPKETLRVDSRVTNLHRSEYPGLRTCAMNVDGSTSGDEIYGEDTESLYNQSFGGGKNQDGTQYDYFLTVSPKTKDLVRARIHVLKILTERNFDCVRLEKM